MDKFEASKGENIYNFVNRIIKELNQSDTNECIATFNDIKLTITKYSFAPDIIVIYSLKCDLRRINRT